MATTKIRGIIANVEWSGRGYITIHADGETVIVDMAPERKEKICALFGKGHVTEWQTEMKMLEEQAIQQMRERLKDKYPKGYGRRCNGDAK